MIWRRDFLQLAGASLAAGALEGCCLFRRDPEPVCPFDPAFTDETSMLAIDVHAHVFNATDLQVKDFVRRIAIQQSGGLGRLAGFAGGLLQRFAWATAPDVADEALKLDQLEPLIRDCEGPGNGPEMLRLRDLQLVQGKAELLESVHDDLQGVPSDPGIALEALPADSRDLLEIASLPERYDRVFTRTANGLPSPDVGLEVVTVSSALKFIIEMFQYRFVSIYNYLEAYSSGQDIKIDLLTPAAVDYDWWISGGKPTRSPLPQQMSLMRKISVLTGGRVHALVPFDPLRQVVHDLGQPAGFSPLSLVEKSVGEYGAVGVKLYPPMGFAPYGNTDVGVQDPDMWKRLPWLPEVASRSDFPRRLDEALAKLYDYCAREDVPVMGHSNASNGPSREFEGLTAPPHWAPAADSFADVSFSFGHFGGAGSDSAADPANTLGFLELMAADQVAGRNRIHADASYFSNIMDDPARLEASLEGIFGYGSAGARPAVDRIMYGADWKMLVAEAGSGHYLSGFNEVVGRLEDSLGLDGLQEKFFGLNAAHFLGLGRGRANRERLERFYDRNEMARTPVWMAKLDAQSPAFSFAPAGDVAMLEALS